MQVLDDNEVSKIVSQVFILYTLVTDIHLVDYFTWRERQVRKWNIFWKFVMYCQFFAEDILSLLFCSKIFLLATLWYFNFDFFSFCGISHRPQAFHIFLFTGITEQLSQKIKILWHKMLKEMNLLNVSSTLKWSLL